MTAVKHDWKKDFGLDTRQPQSLYTSKDEITPSTPQAHLLRRAFTSLEVDGILCIDNSPLIYFKQIRNTSEKALYQLHRKFWNHGGAPILVVISDTQIQVYSGMSRPGTDVPSAGNHLSSHVETLGRVAQGLREFLTAVETGEYFRRYQKFFDPAQRVDRALLDNLRDTRLKLGTLSEQSDRSQKLDALLCRLVFTCYLFDRKVIGASYLESLNIKNSNHLRDVLAIHPPDKAKSALYKLFEQLGKDFNGDLFSDDLKAEATWIKDEHIKTLHDFFQGTSIKTGQGAFWPYDFEHIPIETISAIYERFLKDEDEKSGSFYTPRFLAEVVLDSALASAACLIGKRLLDPACGSGIFLVGLFNRIAEEWKQANPKAQNSTKAKELMHLLQEHVYGVDVNETACRITAFSLYLAYLDQLSPPDIQNLQEKGRALPHLVSKGGNIQCADFFDENLQLPSDIEIIIGNPPWGDIAKPDSLAGMWSQAHDKPIPDNQIAAAFVWKAASHLSSKGRVCFVLPYGLLFNLSPRAVAFQKTWVSTHAIDRVLNLADLRYFLFEKAIHPSIVVQYQKEAPKTNKHRIEYWSPKADWTFTNSEIITIAPQDRASFTIDEVLEDLNSLDAPQMWKRWFWATIRDHRLLDRLSAYPRLRDHVRRVRDKTSAKPWIIAVGFQPVGKNDDPNKVEAIQLPSRLFINASNPAIDLFLLATDCTELPTAEVAVRSGSNKNTEVFRSPHVLFAKGFTSTAYADFAVSFQDAIRGIQGPICDRDLLIFLTAFLRSNTAKFYMFHTSSNWGIYRPEVHVEELLRIPFPLPDQQPHSQRCWEIVHEVAGIVMRASNEANTDETLSNRDNIIQIASEKIEPLIEEYFDIDPLEKILIDDTVNVIIKSIQPTKNRLPVETLKPSSSVQMDEYSKRVCTMLNKWSKRSKYAVRGTIVRSGGMGIGLAVFEKVERNDADIPVADVNENMLKALDNIQKSIPQKYSTLDLVRGVMVFSENRLYVIKPIGLRHWMQTAALNDADEIAGTILMNSLVESA